MTPHLGRAEGILLRLTRGGAQCLVPLARPLSPPERPPPPYSPWSSSRLGRGRPLPEHQGRRARRATGTRGQGRLRYGGGHREQGLVHAGRRRADRRLLPAHRHPEHPGQPVRRDGRDDFTDREDRDSTHRVTLLSPNSLTYRITNTAKSGAWRITKTFVTDPARSSVLEDVRFESLTGKEYQLYLLHDVALSMTGNDDTGVNRGRPVAGVLGRHERQRRGDQPGAGQDLEWLPRHLRRLDRPCRRPRPGRQLRRDHTRQRRTDRPGQGERAPEPPELHRLGRLRLHRRAPRCRPRRRRFSRGFAAARTAYDARLGRSWLPEPVRPSASGLVDRVEGLRDGARGQRGQDVRGGFVAAPNRPWAWSNSLQFLAVYHAVWSRDLYQIATGLLAIGDDAAANRALDFLWNVQQRPDGSFPQNSRLDGTPVFGDLQMDEVAFPIVMAHQLGRTGARRLGTCQEVGRLRGRKRPEDAAGAVGERDRLLTGDNRGRDRRPGLRGGHRDQEQRQRVGGEIPGQGRRVAAGRGVDGRPPRRARTARRSTTCASPRTGTRTPAT